MKDDKIEKMEKVNSAMTALQCAVNDALSEVTDAQKVPDFNEDRKTKPEAAKIAGICVMTLNKLIKAGKFKVYSVGRRKFLLKSEILDALKNDL